MESRATLERSGPLAGQLLVKTHSWTDSDFVGFTGAVYINLFSESGVLLGVTPIVGPIEVYPKSLTFVDPRYNPRITYWNAQFPSSIAAATVRLEIMVLSN
jgi:hypothetical protein